MPQVCALLFGRLPLRPLRHHQATSSKRPTYARQSQTHLELSNRLSTPFSQDGIANSASGSGLALLLRAGFAAIRLAIISGMRSALKDVLWRILNPALMSLASSSPRR